MKFLLYVLPALFLCTVLSAQTPVTIDISDAGVGNGQTFELDVKTTNFSNITTFQFTIVWNTAVLDFDTVGSYNATLPLAASDFNFTLSSQGKIALTWFTASGKTLAADALLFKLKFTALANGTSPVEFSNDPVEIYAENTNGAVPVSPQNGVVNVQNSAPLNDVCSGAVSIQNLFGNGTNNPQTSTIFDNTNAVANPSDPANGHACFYEEVINDPPGVDNSLWFTFTGDGQHYRITTVQCNSGNNYITDGDAQIAVYKGSCGSLVPVDCNEDIGSGNDQYAAQIANLGAEAAKEYYILVDGCRCIGANSALASGQFCLRVEQLSTVGTAEIAAPGKLSLFPNPAGERTDLQFELPINQEVTIDLMDHLGRMVRTVLPTQELPAGIKTVAVELAGLKAGTYFLVLKGAAGNETVLFVKV